MKKIEDLLAGRGEKADLKYLEDLGTTVKFSSRCGLGQASPNPVLSTLQSFRPAYEALARENKTGRQASFDIRAALAGTEKLVGRESVLYTA